MTPKLYLDLSYKQHLEDKLFEGVLYLSSKIFFDKSVLRFSIFNSQFLSTSEKKEVVLALITPPPKERNTFYFFSIKIDNFI